VSLQRRIELDETDSEAQSAVLLMYATPALTLTRSIERASVIALEAGGLVLVVTVALGLLSSGAVAS
jgi:hypothetical protein